MTNVVKSIFVSRGEPLTFYVSPLLKNRSSLVRLIVEHGGTVTKNATAKGTVYQIVDSTKAVSYASAGPNVLVDTFISKSVQLGNLLPIQEYTAAKEYQRFNSATGGTPGRQAYTLKEDYKIFSHAIRSDALGAGTRFWKEAEAINLTSHPWQSMHNRWKRRLSHPKKLKLASISREFLDEMDRQPGTLEGGLYTTYNDESIDDIARKLNLECLALTVLNQHYYQGIAPHAKFYEGSQIVLPNYKVGPYFSPKAVTGAGVSVKGDEPASPDVVEVKLTDTNASPKTQDSKGAAGSTTEKVSSTTQQDEGAATATNSEASLTQGNAKAQTSPAAAPDTPNGQTAGEKLIQHLVVLTGQPRAVVIFALHAFSGEADPAALYLQGIDGVRFNAVMLCASTHLVEQPLSNHNDAPCFCCVGLVVAVPFLGYSCLAVDAGWW